ncbi:structural maintenance of chromosomes protein 6 [Manduca sexta]|uniref:structural maintenance of chromosomes protein 6 n=1 Tax=Manduca sexta TaxID=7130 RepID=UPI00188E08CB|nr:structural maintenance of chromosomes protein 6 [Manduca sexta]
MAFEPILEDIDGLIVSVRVRNFFCHENLEINLNPNVNFIVGRNGSGKSALLSALVVGLGGRAADTNRGSSLSTFIKKGTNSATVEIKIKNNSPNAYKHDVYGDYITVVRTINASGGSSYKVKAASGEVVSTKYEEVNAIILAHDIQVNNPISVLNQDDARSFHNPDKKTSDSKKKYSFFRRATNLDQTMENYEKAQEGCNMATLKWNRKKDACAELEKEYKKWKMSYDQLQSRDEVESQKKKLQNEYYWSEIAELERDYNDIQREYDKSQAKIDKMMRKLHQMNDTFGGSNAIIEALKNKMEEKKQEKAVYQQELQELESQARETQTSLRSAHQATAKQQELLKRERRKVTDLEREISNIESGGAAAERGRLEAAAESARAAAGSARARADTAAHHADQARHHAAHQAQLHDRAAAHAQRQRERLKQLKQEYRELESRGNNSLAVYGKHMVELCLEIQKAVARGEFSAPPKGPVGSYLKVKEKEWGGALEHILGGTVRSFCVNTAEDSRKLFDIMGRVYGRAAKPSVTCSKFLPARHDVSRHRVRAAGHACALDALHVPDVVVANHLIDSLGLEAILLVREHSDAIRLSDNAENVPVNCAKIVTLDTTEYHPAPNYRSYGGKRRESQYLQVSTAERIRQVQAEIEEAEAHLRKLEERAAELSAELRQARAAERGAAHELEALRRAAHDAAEAQRRAADRLQQLHAPHHAVLVEELNVTKNKVESLQEQLDVLLDKEQQCKQRADELDERITQLKEKVAKANKECRILSEEIDQEQMKVDRGMSERAMYEQRVNEDNAKLARVKDILDEKQAVISKKTEQALKLCPKVDNAREKSVVTDELKKIQQKLSSIRSDGMSKAQVAERLLDVQTKYNKTTQDLNRLQTLIHEIKDAISKHLKYCHLVQTRIAARAQHCFNSMLTLRDYTGSMDIDHVNGTLEVWCRGRQAEGAGGAGGAGEGVSALSGGERSYSTVAFIMALWECVDLPFFFMDEYDVFMDNVNRTIVTNILLNHASKHSNRQFVFLTPQDVPNIVASPQISIHVMADPRP